jgi:predicted solute-binding protein
MERATSFSVALRGTPGMSELLNIGAMPHAFCRPVVSRLQADPGLECRLDAAVLNARRVRERSLRAALVSPLEFARDASEFRIVQGPAVLSQQPNNAVSLLFRRGVRNVSTLAADPSGAMDIVLARILLAEEFDVAPAIKPILPGADPFGIDADALLLVGDAALKGDVVVHDALDLVEVWLELTNLPYVHGIWCTRDNELSPAGLAAIRRAHDVQPPDRHRAITEMLALTGPAKIHRSDLSEYFDSFGYALSAEAEDAIREFLHYAYFHGILPDIPDLEFYPD